MKCDHQKCHPSDRLWIPSHVDEEGMESEKIKPHYFCVHCGEVEYKGAEKARDFGYFSNVLGDIKRYFENESKKGSNTKLTSTILRLIMKELQTIDDFNDKFSKPFIIQKQEFIRILRKFFPSYPASFFNSFFDPNPPSYDEDSVNYYGKYYDDLEERYARQLSDGEDEEDHAFFE